MRFTMRKGGAMANVRIGFVVTEQQVVDCVARLSERGSKPSRTAVEIELRRLLSEYGDRWPMDPDDLGLDHAAQDRARPTARRLIQEWS